MEKKMKDIMTRDPKVISPTSTVQEAAKIMKDHNFGVLPVCDGKRLSGMITDRDIVTKVVAEGGNPIEVTVQQAMTSPIVYCFEDQEVEEAARMMETMQIRRLVVLDRDKLLVGIISLGDIALKAGQGYLANEVLTKVSEHSEDSFGSGKVTRPPQSSEAPGYSRH